MKLKAMNHLAMLFLAVVWSMSPLQSQTTIALTFTATQGLSQPALDSIHVKNLTKGSDTTLYGSDTVLVLDYGTGVGEWPTMEGGLLELSAAYPNPFSLSASFQVTVMKEEKATIRIFDLYGREVAGRQQVLPAGKHTFRFRPGNEACYFLLVETAHQRQSQKLVSDGSMQGKAGIEYIDYQVVPAGMRKGTAGFPWDPGDDLMFVGIGGIGGAMVGFDVIEDQPTQSNTYSFALLHGVPCLEEPLVSDIDGNLYRSIRIGSQCWMQQNFKATRLNNGTSIPEVTGNAAWIGLTTPAYCWYSNDSASHAETYGPIYNWYTVGTGNLCPSGWHVPTDAELTVLIDHLGGSTIAGNKLKESGILHWNSPNTGATNESAFYALPGGFREGTDGNYYQIGNNGRYWSSTASSIANAWLRELNNNNGIVYRNNYTKKNGYSVRCIRD